jgi:trimeric autotransporter adhesin
VGTLWVTGGYVGSDRNAKADFAPVDANAVLEKVAALPIQTWRYKDDTARALHMGPMAQDFHQAFGLGENSTSIGFTDGPGVALAAIQGLRQLVQEKDKRIAAQQSEINDLKTRLARIEARLGL